MTAKHQTTAWKRLTLELRPIYQRRIAQGHGVCGRCGRPVLPGQPFDVGHINANGPTTRRNARLEHTKCNRGAGGRVGRAIQIAARATTRGFPSW